MKKFLCAKLLKTKLKIFSSISYGVVDIRDSSLDLPVEQEILNESKKHLEIENNINDFYRLVTMIEASSIKDAIYEAELIFEEIVDLLDEPFKALKNEIIEIGYVCQLEDFKYFPLKKIDNIESMPMNFFLMKYGKFSPITANQYMISGRQDEAVQAFIRSMHWYRKIDSEKSLTFKFLYYWIAIETIAKINEDDNITNKICFSLGFPGGKLCQLISRNLLQRINNIDNYKFWKKILNDKVELMRKLRNNIVHTGFREKDIDVDEINKYVNILSFAFPRMKNYYSQCITSPINSLDEVWEYIPICFEEDKQILLDIQKRIIPLFIKEELDK